MSDLIFLGQETEIFLPSGNSVTFRETNGEDDEILSIIRDNLTGTALLNFLTSITTAYNGDKLKKPTLADITRWPVGDKYYLLFKQRLVNRGDVLNFQHICQNENCPCHSKKDGKGPEEEYEQDLLEFDGDFLNPDYIPRSKYSIHKYPNGSTPEIIFESSSGRKYKYSIMNSELERHKLDIPREEYTKNSVLLLRNISVQVGSEWIKLTNFKSIPSREMSEIRAHIDKNDVIFDPLVEIRCRYCKTPYSYSLFDIPSFYWPEETM